jgi:XTP/dITP diphosphohydrolase
MQDKPTLEDTLELMHDLRRRCEWDRAQTHDSLRPYLIEEAHEVDDAIRGGDDAQLREELGDLLLQVLFHARLAEEAAAGERFTIDDVAADLVAKLVRRHPHVFADTVADSAAAVATNWEAIKQVEKQRNSATDGIAMQQPALALAAKLVSRSSRAGLAAPLPDGDGIGERLLAVVADAVRAGVDPEQALRATARAYRDGIRALEGSDLAGSDLAGSDLAGSDLAGSDLAGSDLEGRNDEPAAG